MSVNHLIQFLAVSQGCRSREELVFELEKVLEVYKFDCYGLLRSPKPDQNPLSLALAGRWPEKWPQIYATKKFALIDPSIRYLAHAHRPYRWSETLTVFGDDPHFKRMQRMMMDAQRFGLEDGYIFPVHGRGGLLGYMTVCGRPVELTQLEIVLFDSVAKCAFWRLAEISGEADQLSTVQKVDVRLTRRELEILTYLAEGMTSNEMSKLLEISNHTVDWYVNELQDKLNAKNRQHMVAMAYRLGLIS
ncbi:helix-turn-helix transcriptional regulator [Allorhizobium taibaishanense]|uniref:LuxR family transcriptional regulator n=1 Tax=Allorhizobium taibaishanense TaxID=887144 RepID=A0A1Q9A2E7_9HYPH|nr:LuxR family transcriptional regulator [Allorhizobium taibaishanense]MBB4009004.1 LuxR family transcriptional regulator [Allorhizobium taibaishanense]OLP48683.1 LuxR family transcriptional regulator [Allorhizobium taibaishanense]